MTTDRSIKVPPAPAKPLNLDRNKHLAVFQAPLWRIFATRAAHAYDWDEPRYFGPVAGCRFDPQPSPAANYAPEFPVMYAATDPSTAFAEVFRSLGRIIDRSADGRAIASWMPTRPLTLLDLTTDWPLVNGASAALMMTDDKNATSAWSHAIYTAFGTNIDGLLHISSMTSRPIITLFKRAFGPKSSFPPRPDFYTLLTGDAADFLVLDAIDQTGYDVVS